jgi:hypothetical protein
MADDAVTVRPTMPRPQTTLTVACLALVIAGCSTLNKAGCRHGEQSAISEMIYFGTGIPGGGTVSSEEWAVFLRTAVTPRFPSGLTVWSASGQWQSADGSITSESSFVLNLLHPATPDAEADVQAVATEYKTRFKQEAVLRVRAQACISL